MNLNDPLPVPFNGWDKAYQAMLTGTSTPPKARNIRISLKQWRMFHAVVDAGGFVGAAERLHVSQSSISHALAKLQEQIGLPLLALKGRKAQLTEDGKVLLARSRELVRCAMELEELAEHLRQGLGAELRIAVDPDFPPDLLMRALREQELSTHGLRLSIQEATADHAGRALRENAVDLAISAAAVPGFVSRELIGIEYVAVAHRDNPLFTLKRDLVPDDLKDYCQVSIAGSEHAAADERRQGQHSLRSWRVHSLDRAVTTLSQGLSYAWLPKYRLQGCLEAGLLKMLPLQEETSRIVRLYLVHEKEVATNPSVERFAASLRRLGARVY